MREEINKDLLGKMREIEKALVQVPNQISLEAKKTLNFKGRKSELIAGKVLDILCDKKKTVLYDPFMGSGTFVQAAMGRVKEVYATELDNYTFQAVSALMQKADLNKLERQFQELKKSVQSKIMNLYETECCGKKNHIAKILFDPGRGEKGLYYPTQNREIKNGENIKLVEKCPVCGKKTKRFETIDYKKMKELEVEDVSAFPNREYIENSRINITVSTGANRYGKIFTHRNKLALLYLQEAILKLEQGMERDILEQVLVSTLSLARIAMYGSSTDILYHVLSKGAQDMNVWMIFEEKYKNFYRFKEKYEKQQIGISNTKAYLYNMDYGMFVDKNPDLQVDLIYSDFPYTDQVPYLERNQLYRIWLETFYDCETYKLTEEMLEQEIVLTNAPKRADKRRIDRYYQDIGDMFARFYRILKPEGLAFFTIKLGKEKYFKTFVEIINLARKNGFELISEIEIEKKDPTIRKQSAFLNTLVSEMIIVFCKLPKQDQYWYIGEENYEFLLAKKIYRYILKVKDKATFSQAVYLGCNDLKSRYELRIDEKLIERIKQVIYRYFVINKGFIEVDSTRLYMEIEDSTELYMKLYNLIPIYIRILLEEKGKFVLEDIYKELTYTLCDGNPQTIDQILKDKTHQYDIENLILNYCEEEDNYYVERKSIGKQSAQAKDISTLNGTEFELLIVRLLKAMGYTKVVRTGGAGDLGVDIIAEINVHGERKKFLFQCKRWISNVGAEPIQRLFAEKVRRNMDGAICITTSDYTSDGNRMAKELGIDIVNGEQLMKKLYQYFPGEYYHSILLKK